MNKNIGTIEGKISKLETRKHDLQAELTELEVGINETTNKLGDAILAGGNTGKIEADLVQMTVRETGLEAAISKADADLGGLGSELDIERTKATRLEIEANITRVRAEMAAAADVVMQLSDDSARWDQELRGVADRAHAMHLMQENGVADHLRGLWSFSMHQLKGAAADLNSRRPYQTGRPIDELRN